MKALSSTLTAIVLAVLVFAAGPTRAETPADQIKAAGAIPLTAELLDKMDKFVHAMDKDAAAKTELASVGNDPSTNPDTMGSTISAKCPKTVAIFKANALTPDEFVKAIFAIMAVAMSDDLTKSEDKAVKANADFFAANKEKCNLVFGGFMALSMPAEPSSSPASTP
jgi:hypothetical protein